MSECDKRLHGIIPAIVTPITRDGMLDVKLLEKQTKYLLDSGVQGLFICGGTGEGAYLKTEEKKQILNTIKNIAGEVYFYVRHLSILIQEQLLKR